MEFFPAVEWGGPQGLYRLRMGRKWLEGTHGTMRFLTVQEVAALLAYHIFGVDLREATPAPRPDHLPRKSLVSVRTGGTDEHPLHDVTRISSEAPVLGADGRWYVAVHLYGRGTVLVPAEECHPR
ncbi:hypothetical protein [Nitratidesulfovibrio termitidis]|uniref:hypothetical protein n=1 Tax=Nitratidesulfovibrio termitidis TaxID=42252 RepID=UPI001FE1044D|nr:hypothetical protein [Nitratidesulfovibrio termitidis]